MAALNFPSSPSDGDTYTPSGSTITYEYSSSKGSWQGQLSGSAATVVSLSGSTNNQVVTVTGANAITGESNLTFDGSTLAVTGATTVSTDLTVGDDIYLDSDAAVLHLGDDGDVTLTHVADTGVLLNSTRQLQFGDSGTYIHQSADGVLDLVSDTELELNATTIDINGAVEISGTLAQVGVATFTARDVHNGGITVADGGQIGSASDTDAITIAADGTVTFSSNLTVTGTTTLNGNLVLGDAAADTLTVGATIQGASPLTFEGGTADGFETTFAITDPTADRTITFQNASGTVAFTSDDITGNAATVTSAANNSTNETVYLTFVDGQTGAQEIETDVGLTYNPSTGLITSTSVTAGTVTSTGNVVIADAGNIGSASDTDAIAIGADGDVTLTQDLELQHDGAILSFGADNEVTLTHSADSGLTLGVNHTSTAGVFVIDQAGSGDPSIQMKTAATSYMIGVDNSDSDTFKIDYGTTGVGGQTGITLNTSGNVTMAADLTLGDDLYLDSDGSVIHFGDDGEVTLTHVADTGLRMEDSDRLIFGADSDLQIYHDGSSTSYVHAAAGNMYISGTGTNSIIMQAKGGENSIVMTGDAGVTLYYDGNAARLSTSSGGISVTGTATMSANVIIGDGSTIGSASDTDAITIASGGAVTFSQRSVHSSGITIANGANIGSAGDADSIAIASDGVVTFSQRPVIGVGGLTIPNDGQIGSASDPDAIAISSSGDVTYSQQIYTSDGTASNPAIAFSDDTDTGWYSATDGEQNWSLNGTMKMHLDSTGLDVEGTILCTPTSTLTIADSGGTVQKTVYGVGST